MNCIKNTLACGNIVVDYKNCMATFTVSISSGVVVNIIPFFSKYPLQGSKNLDFMDFCKIANIMLNKSHLTTEGLEEIRQIKFGMNTGRGDKKPLSETLSSCSEEYEIDERKKLIIDENKNPTITNKYIYLYVFIYIYVNGKFGPIETCYWGPKGRSGIYRWTNKSTGDIYIGQSTNLSARFKNKFPPGGPGGDYNISYLSSKIHLIISRALIKYGYSNFSLRAPLHFY